MLPELTFCNSSARSRIIHSRTVERDLAPGSASVKRAYLDRSPAGNGGLAPPRQRLVQVSGFQHPKTAHVFLGLYVRPVGDEHLTGGLRPYRPRASGRGEAANENPDTSSLHLLVERVDVAGHRFVLCGWVIVVGMVDSNQILRHDSLL